MSEASTTAVKIGEWFQAGELRTLVTRPLRESAVTMAHVSRDYTDGDPTVLIPSDDAFLILLYMIDVVHSDLWPNTIPSPPRLYPKNTICLISLADGASIAVQGEFDALVIHIPRGHLVEIADHTGEARVDDLATCRGLDDPTVKDIGAALLPLIRQDLPDGALVAHIALALNAHIAHRYGRSRKIH